MITSIFCKPTADLLEQSEQSGQTKMSDQKRYLFIIGSSNSRRVFQPNVAHLTKLSGCEIQIKSATSFNAGREGVKSLKGNDIAIISFLTNTLVEECDALQPAEIEDKIKTIMRDYIEVIKSIPESVTIVMMYPYPRAQPPWVFEWINWIHNQLNVNFETMGSNLHRIPYTPVQKEDFDSDFIHLKQLTAQKQYKEFAASYAQIFGLTSDLDTLNDQPEEVEMLDSAESAHNSNTQRDSREQSSSQWGEDGATPVDTTATDQWGNPRVQTPKQTGAARKRMAPTNRQNSQSKVARLNRGQTSSQENNGSREYTNQWSEQSVRTNNSFDRGGGRGRAGHTGTGRPLGPNMNRPPPTLENSVRNSTTLEDRIRKIEERTTRLEMEMVNNNELAEAAINRANAASVIVDNLPFGRDNRRWSAIEIARELVKSLGKSWEQVTMAFFLGGGQSPPPGKFARLKVLFDSEKSAFDFRMDTNAARWEGRMPWVSTFVSNDPTKGTKVRIEILQQIAKVVQNTAGGEGADILVSKYDPRPMLLFKKNGKVYRRINYGEALTRFGSLVDLRSYELARRIAGRQFEGRMNTVFGI